MDFLCRDQGRIDGFYFKIIPALTENPDLLDPTAEWAPFRWCAQIGPIRQNKSTHMSPTHRSTGRAHADRASPSGRAHARAAKAMRAFVFAPGINRRCLYVAWQSLWGQSLVGVDALQRSGGGRRGCAGQRSVIVQGCWDAAVRDGVAGAQANCRARRINETRCMHEKYASETDRASQSLQNRVLNPEIEIRSLVQSQVNCWMTQMP